MKVTFRWETRTWGGAGGRAVKTKSATLAVSASEINLETKQQLNERNVTRLCTRDCVTD